jgi:hypothetical protein
MKPSKSIQKRTFSKVHQLLPLVLEISIYHSVTGGSNAALFEICTSTVRLFGIIIIEAMEGSL